MAETVSKTTAAVGGAEAAPAAPVGRKSSTDWSVMEKGGFVPVQMKCNGYLGSHPSDRSCKTSFPPTAENVERHMVDAHGGGWFKVKFRITDGKPSPLWAALQEAGVELQHFYCPHCRSEVHLSARSILQHLQPHSGANRVNIDPQTLCMTLSYQQPEDSDRESLFMRQSEQGL